MKKLLVFVTFNVVALTGIGQTFLKKFSEKQGLFWDTGSKINYNITDNRFGLTLNEVYTGDRNSTYDDTKNINLILNELTDQDYFIVEFDGGLTLEKENSSLFGNGQFNANFDLSLFAGYEMNYDNKLFLPFVRIGYERSKNDFVFNDTTLEGNPLLLEEMNKNLFGIHGGFNWGLTEDVYISVSGGYFNATNWEGDLESQEVCQTISTGVDTSGNSISINDCKEAFNGYAIPSANIGTLRFDFFFRPIKFGDDVGIPSIGFLFSGAARFLAGKVPRYSIGVGPTFHRPLMGDGDHPDIICSLLFQWNGLYNGISNEDIWDKKFGINLNVGIPFSIFKFK